MILGPLNLDPGAVSTTMTDLIPQLPRSSRSPQAYFRILSNRATCLLIDVGVVFKFCKRCSVLIALTTTESNSSVVWPKYGQDSVSQVVDKKCEMCFYQD